MKSFTQWTSSATILVALVTSSRNPTYKALKHIDFGVVSRHGAE